MKYHRRNGHIDYAVHPHGMSGVDSFPSEIKEKVFRHPVQLVAPCFPSGPIVFFLKRR